MLKMSTLAEQGDPMITSGAIPAQQASRGRQGRGLVGHTSCAAGRQHSGLVAGLQQHAPVCWRDSRAAGCSSQAKVPTTGVSERKVPRWMRARPTSAHGSADGWAR